MYVDFTRSRVIVALREREGLVAVVSVKVVEEFLEHRLQNWYSVAVLSFGVNTMLS